MQKNIENKCLEVLLSLKEKSFTSFKDKNYQKSISLDKIKDLYLIVFNGEGLQKYIELHPCNQSEYCFIVKNALFILFNDEEIVNYIENRLRAIHNSDRRFLNTTFYPEVFGFSINLKNENGKRLNKLFGIALENHNHQLSDSFADILCTYISNNNLIKEFKDKYKIENQQFGSILRATIARFSDDVLIDYFCNSLITICNNDDLFTYIRSEPGFDRTVCLNHSMHYLSDEDKRLRKIYQEGYNKYFETACFPQWIRETAIDRINNMISVAGFGKRYYRERTIPEDVSLIDFYDRFILPVVGAEQFKRYCDHFAKEYTEADVYREYEHSQANLPAYFNYILGLEYKAKTNYKDSESIRLCLLSILPHILNNLPDVVFRRIINKYDLSEDEIRLAQDESKKYPISTNSFNTPKTFDMATAVPLRYGKTTLSDLTNYIDKWFNDNYLKTMQESCRFGIHDIFNKCPDPMISKNIKHILTVRDNFKYRSYLVNYKNQKTKEFESILLNSNKEETKSDKDCFMLFFRNNNGAVNRQTVDFSSLSSEQFKKTIRDYINELYDNGELFAGNHANYRINHIIHFFDYMNNYQRIDSISGIKDVHILAYLQHLYKIKGNSESTIAMVMSSIRIFYEFVISETDAGILVNPISKVKIKRIEGHLRTTPPIPDEVLLFLDNHIYEMDNIQAALIYDLTSWTAFRFSDVCNAKAFNLEKINNDIAKISVETSKTRTQLRKKGIDDLITDYIPVYLYEKLCSFVGDTTKLREKYGIETIFFTLNKTRYNKINVNSFNRSINRFLKNNNVTTLDGSAWNFTHRQQRKTVACTLINNGATSTEVQQKLGHISKETAKKYYIEVDRMKLNELNHIFFNKQFHYLISPERLSLYSEEERRKLYRDFCMNSRETELGVCTLHPSEGRCSVLTNGTCSTCSKICTGKKWLEKWIKLRNDSKQYIDELIRLYKENNIPESNYSNFIEYKQENKLLNHYSKIIEMIENEGTTT